MTNNTKLKINQVVVKRRGSDVYNQTFHSGVNIIRGKNSTGKSTIMELISYGLGADIKKQNWKEEALLCDEIFIDLFLNSNRIVFKRPIEGEGSKPPIYMKIGDYNSSIESLEDWHIYKYQKTEQRESFASRIFDLLGYEQHTTDDSEKLTVHQIFRLLYADQDTPSSNIFRWESLNYDKESMRTAIGEFLFGFDNLTAHAIRQKLILANSKFSKIEDELKAIYSVLGKTNINASTTEINNEISKLNNDLLLIAKERSQMRSMQVNHTTVEASKESQKISVKIEHLSQHLIKLRDLAVSLHYDIKENESFLKTLDNRKLALKNSQVTVNSLGIIDFEYCPCCMTKIETESELENTCSLCKSEVEVDSLDASYLQALEKLDFQIKETRQIIDRQVNEKAEIAVNLTKTNQTLNQLKSQLSEVSLVTDDFELALIKSSTEYGYIESQIQSLSDKLELAAELDLKVVNKNKLQAEINMLTDELERIERTKDVRKKKVLALISSLVVKILSNDTGTEKRFNEAEKFEFDFGNNLMLLDGRANFSASSNVLLKNAFHLAVLKIATNDNLFRVPCFMMLDNIEGGGMTDDRSNNFQTLLVEICDEITTDYQVLMTTSMIAPSLNNDLYGVGPFYESGMHTLDI